VNGTSLFVASVPSSPVISRGACRSSCRFSIARRFAPGTTGPCSANTTGSAWFPASRCLAGHKRPPSRHCAAEHGL